MGDDMSETWPGMSSVTHSTPASPHLEAHVISVIGVTLFAAIIALGVVMLIRHFGGRSTPVVTPTPAGEQSEAARKAVEILARVRAAYASLEA